MKLRDKQLKRTMMMGKTEVKSPSAGRFDPIVLLKDPDIRRKV
jgi:hypothetical protein